VSAPVVTIAVDTTAAQNFRLRYQGTSPTKSGPMSSAELELELEALEAGFEGACAQAFGSDMVSAP
jgi:hypothetical protein